MNLDRLTCTLLATIARRMRNQKRVILVALKAHKASDKQGLNVWFLVFIFSQICKAAATPQNSSNPKLKRS